MIVSPEEADHTLTLELAAPPPVVWEWLTDPVKRTRYNQGQHWSAASRPGGRTGVGAQNHCAHGKDALSVETILDWRPFEYYTTDGQAKADQETWMDTVETVYLEPLDEGRRTRVHHRFKLKTPGLVYRLVLGGFISFFIKKVYRRAEAMMMEDLASLELETAEPSPVASLVSGLSGDGQS